MMGQSTADRSSARAAGSGRVGRGRGRLESRRVTKGVGHMPTADTKTPRTFVAEAMACRHGVVPWAATRAWAVWTPRAFLRQRGR